MTTSKEIKKVLMERAVSIVDERILPEALDGVAEWTGEIMGKLTTLNPENQEQIDQAFNQIHQGLIDELISQLKEPLSARRKKLLEK